MKVFCNKSPELFFFKVFFFNFYLSLLFKIRTISEKNSFLLSKQHVCYLYKEIRCGQISPKEKSSA